MHGHLQCLLERISKRTRTKRTTTTTTRITRTTRTRARTTKRNQEEEQQKQQQQQKEEEPEVTEGQRIVVQEGRLHLLYIADILLKSVTKHIQMKTDDGFNELQRCVRSSEGSKTTLGVIKVFRPTDLLKKNGFVYS